MEFQGKTDPRPVVKYDPGEVTDSMTNTWQTCKHTLDTFTSLTLHAVAGHAAGDSILFKNNTNRARARLVVLHLLQSTSPLCDVTDRAVQQ